MQLSSDYMYVDEKKLSAWKRTNCQRENRNKRVVVMRKLKRKLLTRFVLPDLKAF